jgi:hypothetical protein
VATEAQNIGNNELLVKKVLKKVNEEFSEEFLSLPLVSCCW